MQLFQGLGQSGKTQGVLVVTFFTLTLTAFAFLFAIYSLDHKNREIFHSVQNDIEQSSHSGSLYRMLVQLELDTRELITVILREPYRLTETKDSLKNQFELILAEAEKDRNNPEQLELLKQLRWYRINLNRRPEQCPL